MTVEPHPLLTANLGTVITVSDIRVLYCTKGMRKIFVTNGADFERFLKDGMTVAELMGYGFDGMLERVLQHKAERELAENGR